MGNAAHMLLVVLLLHDPPVQELDNTASGPLEER